MWAADLGSGALWLGPQPATCVSRGSPFHVPTLPTCLKVVSAHLWLKVSFSGSLWLFQVTVPLFIFISSLVL